MPLYYYFNYNYVFTLDLSINMKVRKIINILNVLRLHRRVSYTIYNWYKKNKIYI